MTIVTYRVASNLNGFLRSEITVCSAVQICPDHSYGIQVSRLAVLPSAILTLAQEILHELESG
jgi:hypothetical protein